MRLSAILKKRCKTSIMTLWIGISSNSGIREQLYFFGDLAGTFDAREIDSMVRAPFFTSVIDHSFVVS